MYAIEEGSLIINDEVVETYKRDLELANVKMEVEAGTTGYSGSISRDEGSRSYICISCSRGDFCFNPLIRKDGRVVGIQIAACGDAGLDALMQALEFAHQVMNDQRHEIDN